MSFAAAMLPGNRLHLQHGPIDLVIGADGARERAFKAATDAFDGVLEDLVAELDLLRQDSAMLDDGAKLRGAVAKRMQRAVVRHEAFATPMAAVAGAVADHVLDAMVREASPRRAYVNNGGDIALHLAEGESYRMAIASPDADGLGSVHIRARDGIRGIATSGRGGRSLSMGIADGVTVLACDAAAADAAATLIANAVDLPAHPEIRRAAAAEVRPDSDLGARAVVIGLGTLSAGEVEQALMQGIEAAGRMRAKGLIVAAALFLQGQARAVGAERFIGAGEMANA